MTPDERAIAAENILDEIGFISGSARISSNAILFVGDMQEKLSTARAREKQFYCSEKQLEWLESIREQV
jgi:hypothetical protein